MPHQPPDTAAPDVESQPTETPLRKARKAKGLHQEQLAEAAGCAQATISEIERGKYQPSLALAIRLSEILEQPIHDLFAEDVA